MKHMWTEILETERLILRPFHMDDAQAMYKNWASDDDVTKFLTWETHKDVETTKAVLESFIPNYEKDNFYHWAIVLKEIGEPIGSIDVIKLNDKVQMVHIGFCIGKKWWHRGIASEALSELIWFFFEAAGVNRVESRHDPNNPNSGKVMLKCGMVYEGTKRRGDWNNQGICDCAEYGIIAEDYFRRKEAMGVEILKNGLLVKSAGERRN